MKQKTNKIISCSPGFTIDKNMPNYGNDPYFIKKAEKARENLIKYGIPEKLKAYLEKNKLEVKKQK